MHWSSDLFKDWFNLNLRQELHFVAALFASGTHRSKASQNQNALAFDRDPGVPVGAQSRVCESLRMSVTVLVSAQFVKRFGSELFLDC